MRWPTEAEWLVIGTVFLGLVLFELGPKLLNRVKKNRGKQAGLERRFQAKIQLLRLEALRKDVQALLSTQALRRMGL